MKLLRLLRILYVLLKHGFIFKRTADPTTLRLALEKLGPLFVKCGQLLSTRGDVLPESLITELAKLQDKVSPFSGELAKQKIEKSLQQPLSALFATFEMTPLASASISQVHAATLLNGEKVVVKVLRPHILKQIRKDIGLLETLAKWLYRFVPSLRRFRPIDVIAEMKHTLLDELDLLREAANASQLRRNFTPSSTLYVPRIFWDYCRKEVLVIERIYGIPISDIPALKAKKVDLKHLAEQGVEIFFTQVFRDCFFHADMHPGNIFIKADNPQHPSYMAVDFGIMGTLSPEDQRYLGENFLAFFKRDYRRVAELHVQSGWVPPHTRVEAFEAAIRTVCEPIFERPFKEISIGQTLLRLFQTARRFDMQVQPQLILLQKTLLTIEGLGRQLYPDLDLWHTAKPFLEKWMKTQFGPRALLRTLKNKFRLWEFPPLPPSPPIRSPSFFKKSKLIRKIIGILLLIVGLFGLLSLLYPQAHDAWLALISLFLGIGFGLL